MKYIYKINSPVDNVHLVTVNNSITELFEDRASKLLIKTIVLPFG